MEAVFVQAGATVDYTPGADVVAGQVVLQTDLVGVAKVPIASGTLGALTVDGVYDFAKTAGSSTAIAAGVLCYWDNSNKVATATSSGNKLIGKSVKAAIDADTTVRVRMNQ